MTKENLYIIGYGLSGGFGGAQNFEVVEAQSLKDAENQAYELAIEEFEQYSGTNGLRDISEIMEEDEVDEDDAEIIYNEEREDWLDYIAKPYSKEYEEEVSGFWYQNNYKEITG